MVQLERSHQFKETIRKEDGLPGLVSGFLATAIYGAMEGTDHLEGVQSNPILSVDLNFHI